MASSFTEEDILIPGPKFRVDLSALDARHPEHYSRRLLIFRCTFPEQRLAQLAALKSGLQALIVQCPILGGVVVTVPGTNDGQRDWRTIIPGKGLELIVKDLRTKMSSFEELETACFPPIQLPYHMLMPMLVGSGDDGPPSACKMQFSAIEDGTILTFAMSHCVADGSATNELTRILSNETRLAQYVPFGNSEEVGKSKDAITGIGLDRSVLRDITSEKAFDIRDHPAYTWQDSLPLGKTPSHPFEATSSEIPILCRVSPSNLAQLKAEATTPGAPPISTHDALAALVWRSVLLVRSKRSESAKGLPRSTKGSIFLPSDARRHLDLPDPYIGNAVYQLTASLDMQKLFSSSGLQHAATALRGSVTSVNTDLVRNYFTKLKRKWIGWQFMQTYSTTGVAMGTDWTSGELYNQDWGPAFGPLVRFRYPGEAGLNCIFPKLPDGGAELVICVMPDETELLKSVEGLGKYIV